jgi:plasmid replication initiation protein
MLLYGYGGDLMKQIHNDLIVKSNKLVEASYKLTAGEQKIIYKLTSIINKNDDDFKEYSFKISEFIKLLGIKDQSKYTEIPKITKGLMKKVFTIHDEKGELQISWLSSVRYLKGTGEVILKFDSNLKPLLLELKKEFTKFNIKNVIRFKSFYSMRIYELLKQYSNIGERIFELNDLRYILGIEPEEYKLYSDFKRYVIKQAQKEINSNKTDMSFEFEEIKTGRKVTSIKFIIKSNRKNNPKDEIAAGAVASKIQIQQKQDLIKEVQAMFTEHKITKAEASCILKDANNNIDLIKQCYTYLLDKNVKNIVGYMRKLVKGFNEPQENKTSTFNNFKQRDYDFKELEMKLLGWK